MDLDTIAFGITAVVVLVALVGIGLGIQRLWQLRRETAAETHKHCWHLTGLVKTSMPPQTEFQCCWCGQRKDEVMRPLPPVDGWHGPHKPAK